jgi:hypothetical protein
MTQSIPHHLLVVMWRRQTLGLSDQGQALGLFDQGQARKKEETMEQNHATQFMEKGYV